MTKGKLALHLRENLNFVAFAVTGHQKLAQILILFKAYKKLVALQNKNA